MRDARPLARRLVRAGLGLAARLTPRPSTNDGRGAAEVTTELARLTDAGQHDAAIALARATIGDLGTDAPFLDQVRATAGAAGELSLQREATLLRLHGLRSPLHAPLRARMATNARVLEGRWLETSPDWAPTIEPSVLEGLTPVTDPVPGRVLHVVKQSLPRSPSGYTFRSRYNLLAQRDAGLDPVVVTEVDYGPSVGAPAEELVDGIRTIHLSREDVPENEPWDAHLDAWATALAPVVAAVRPAAIVAHSGSRGYEGALVALAVGRALGVPVVYEVRGFFESLWGKDLGRVEAAEVFRRRRDTDTRCMEAADAVVTLSETMRADIVGRGVPASRVHVMPNGVDTEAFSPEEPGSERARAVTDLRARLGLTDRFTFGYVSNLDHRREAQELLVDAAVELNRRGVAASAVIVGDGLRRAEIEDHARATGALERGEVVITGRVPHEQVLDHYALLDVFVVPRIDERAARLVSPLKPFEAMAAGRAVVVSDLPALSEIVGSGDDARGAVFTAGDASSLADVLGRLAGDPAERDRLGAAARAWVVAHRRWADNGPRYAEIIRNL